LRQAVFQVLGLVLVGYVARPFALAIPAEAGSKALYFGLACVAYGFMAGQLTRRPWL
jgi:hypothetical protein